MVRFQGAPVNDDAPFWMEAIVGKWGRLQKPDRVALAAIVVLIRAALQSASCAAAETPATDLVLGDAGPLVAFRP